CARYNADEIQQDYWYFDLW
nr:immunoglobulin heavy chain junction region [Macaca mulatta]MOW77886.1 immunoglobulin heavy chain junction region [Macaca mulatta]MOW83337.1 immunoglobulin heavy chain junction region [Macaca mulatta]MOW85096.1 immunoglobulin heavy chain junction region [Macaca mulatta]